METAQGKVLVTGATGFIGARLVKALLGKGYTVRCLVRRPEVSLPEGIEKAHGDLLERAGAPTADKVSSA
ncbi:MAG TPA: NAD-dependent epimerase/dehydratase family protein [Geobacteraceae bacterium]|nr:NAD-dependent epimerase/dehydratase family protein [Geobacteraceae bacterium]